MFNKLNKNGIPSCCCWWCWYW